MGNSILQWDTVSHWRIEKIDKFDMGYKGDDPGLDPKAPYHREHMKCLELEKHLCEQLYLHWDIFNEDTVSHWRIESSSESKLGVLRGKIGG